MCRLEEGLVRAALATTFGFGLGIGAGARHGARFVTIASLH